MTTRSSNKNVKVTKFFYDIICDEELYGKT